MVSSKQRIVYKILYLQVVPYHFPLQEYLTKELRRKLEEINKKEFPKAKLYHVKTKSEGKIEELFRHIFIDSSVSFIKEKMNLHSNDLLFIGIGPYSEVVSVFNCIFPLIVK